MFSWVMNLGLALTLTLVLVLITVFCASVLYASPPQKRPPVVVEIAKVEQKKLFSSVEGLGTLQAKRSITLRPNVAGYVKMIHFQDGRAVKTGDIILEFDSTEEQAQLSSASATLKEAQAAYDRAKGLIKTKDISEATLTERKTDLMEAQARVDELTARLDDLTIKAPFDGVVGLSNLSEGAYLEPGDVIAALDDLQTMRVDVEVPSLYINRISAGQGTVGRVDAIEDKVFKGKVTSVDSRVDSVSRSMLVRTEIQNPDQTLKTGMVMAVKVMFQEREAIVIPSRSVVLVGQKAFVFILDPASQTVKRVEVKTGLFTHDAVEVLSGLKVGEHVISEGHIKLKEGAKVQPKTLK